jgi:hypothetical protein
VHMRFKSRICNHGSTFDDIVVPDLLRAFSSVLTSASDFLVLVGTE